MKQRTTLQWALLLLALALALVLGLAACGKSNDARSPRDGEMPELVVPKITDASAATPASSSKAARVPKSTKSGWIRTAEQRDPKFLDRSIVLSGMRDAVKQEGYSLVVLSFDTKIEECSSAGGSHSYFTVIEPGGPTVSGDEPVIHFGGHGTYLMHAFERTEPLWVAAVDIKNQPYSTKNDAWCVPDRMVHGEAKGMVPVASREEGVQLVEEINAFTR